MNKYPKIYVGGRELKTLNVTQDEHDDPWWNGHKQGALDFGWGTFGDPNIFADQDVTSDGNIKVTFIEDGPVTSRYMVIDFIDWGNYRMLIAHEDVPSPLWSIVQPGQRICRPGRNNPNGNHLHVSVEKDGQYFSCREFVFNNEEPDPVPSPDLEQQIKDLTKRVEVVEGIIGQAGGKYKELGDIFVIKK